MTLLTPSSPQIPTVMAHHSFPHPWFLGAVFPPHEVNESAAIDLQQHKLAFHLNSNKQIQTQCCQGWRCMQRTGKNQGNEGLNTNFSHAATARCKPSLVCYTTCRVMGSFNLTGTNFTNPPQCSAFTSYSHMHLHRQEFKKPWENTSYNAAYETCWFFCNIPPQLHLHQIKTMDQTSALPRWALLEGTSWSIRVLRSTSAVMPRRGALQVKRFISRSKQKHHLKSEIYWLGNEIRECESGILQPLFEATGLQRVLSVEEIPRPHSEISVLILNHT